MMDAVARRMKKMCVNCVATQTNVQSIPLTIEHVMQVLDGDTQAPPGLWTYVCEEELGKCEVASQAWKAKATVVRERRRKKQCPWKWCAECQQDWKVMRQWSFMW